jgi:hypothetical protein
MCFSCFTTIFNAIDVYLVFQSTRFQSLEKKNKKGDKIFGKGLK